MSTVTEEQEVTMSSSIRTIEGIGPQVAQIFEDAGFATIASLRNFDMQDKLLKDAIDARRVASSSFPASYWRRLFTRCINVLYRVRSAEAIDFVPHEYMCPLSLDWFRDPVVTASGQSYSREYILEHLQTSSLDPVTRMDIAGKPLYDNVALRNAVEHYRVHFQRFRILS